MQNFKHICIIKIGLVTCKNMIVLPNNTGNKLKTTHVRGINEVGWVLRYILSDMFMKVWFTDKWLPCDFVIIQTNVNWFNRIKLHTCEKIVVVRLLKCWKFRKILRVNILHVLVLYEHASLFLSELLFCGIHQYVKRSPLISFVHASFV